MPDTGSEFVAYETDVREGVAVVRLQRPAKKNAISGAMRDAIADAVDAFADADDQTVLVVTGAGDAFSAGTDIDELTDRRPETLAEAVAMEGFDLPEQLAALDEPTIAMINGVAVGGGFELALGCDFRVASADATFGFPELSLGGLPGEGGTQRLVAETNAGTASYLVLTGETVDAEWGLREGVVQEVVDPDDLEERTLSLAASMAGRNRAALLLAKRALTAADRSEFERGLATEELFANLIELTPERRKRIEEFLS